MWRPNRQRHRNYLPGLRDIWKRGEWRIVRLWEQRELQGVNGGVEARAQKWIQRSSIDRAAILRSLKATFNFPHQHTSIFNQNLCQSFCLILISPGPRGAVDTSFYLMYMTSTTQDLFFSPIFHSPSSLKTAKWQQGGFLVLGST